MSGDGYFEASDHLAFFWKGRVALYALLDALGVGPGDEVVVPGFTCVVVPNAVLYRGAEPVYADIDPATYNVTAEEIDRVFTSRTRLIVVQSTFGLSPDLDPILELADSQGVPVVEDCAHGLGGRYKGTPNGNIADASFMSLQWSKPISTGRGGVAYTPDPSLAERVRAFQASHTSSPGLADQGVLLAQLAARPLLDMSGLYYPLVRLYRFMTQRLGVIAGSSSPEELNCTEMPDGYLKRACWIQREGFRRGIKRLRSQVEARRDRAHRYDDLLRSHGLDPPVRPHHSYHGMLRYPFRVKKKDKLLRQAEKLDIPVGDWFNSPIHPVTTELSRWGYEQGSCPKAERACREVVNFFTDRELAVSKLHRLLTETGK